MRSAADTGPARGTSRRLATCGPAARVSPSGNDGARLDIQQQKLPLPRTDHPKERVVFFPLHRDTGPHKPPSQHLLQRLTPFQPIQRLTQRARQIVPCSLPLLLIGVVGSSLSRIPNNPHDSVAAIARYGLESEQAKWLYARLFCGASIGTRGPQVS